jgi:hypothetical protein
MWRASTGLYPFSTVYSIDVLAFDMRENRNMKNVDGFWILVSFFVLFLTNCGEESKPILIEPDDQVKAITNVNLVTMTDDKVIANQTVLIEGAKI